jgi:hypothetical protein
MIMSPNTFLRRKIIHYQRVKNDNMTNIIKIMGSIRNINKLMDQFVTLIS